MGQFWQRYGMALRGIRGVVSGTALVACMIFATTTTLAAPGCGQNPEPTAADKPNIVWLISEDNSKHWLKIYDPSGAATPRISELANHGLTFNHAFSNAPVCSVARTTLITSCLGPRIGTQFHRKAVSVPMPDGVQMFPALLRQAGYYTANNNKKDYNATEGSGVWDDSSRKATWGGRSAGQPFFYMQSFATTHESSLHFPDADVDDRPTVHSAASVTLAPYHPDTPLFRYTYARYLDRIQQVDQQIGNVVDRLKSDGLLEDTFIFYFGDHGGVLPRGKGYAYESGLHVPLVIRVPERWKHLVDRDLPSRVDGFVSFIDFGATVLSLADIELPEGIDGRPFLGRNVRSEDVDERDEAFGYADRFDEKYDFVRTLRKGRFKYIRNYQPFNIDSLHNNYRYLNAAFREWRQLSKDGKLNAVQQQFFSPRPAEQLFDLNADPHETSDLANDPNFKSQLLMLRTRLGEIVRTLPDLSFVPESELAREAFQHPVEFGQANQAKISRLADIADAPLHVGDAIKSGQAVEVSSVLHRLAAARASEDWLERYWGVISTTAIGSQFGWNHVRSLKDDMLTIARNDASVLVRCRAAEFLGLSGLADPREFLSAAISGSTSDIEAGLILNSAALLHDVGTWGFPNHPFAAMSQWPVTVEPSIIPDGYARFDAVKRRLEYLAPAKKENE
ncbi:MAG: sulfatase [Planctomycetaceae bacterium]